MHNYEEVSNDALSIRGFQEYRCNDYHLEFVAEDVLYYIVSPKDVVLAKMRDEDDHVDWLLAHDKYDEALETVQAHVKELKRHNFQDISREYIKYLVEEGLYEDAALQCSKSLKTRPQWEEQVYTFARIGQLKVIAPYLPKGEIGGFCDKFDLILAIHSIVSVLFLHLLFLLLHLLFLLLLLLLFL